MAWIWEGIERDRVVSLLMEGLPWIDLSGNPHATQTYRPRTLEETIAKLEEIRDSGLNVPGWVLDDMREELAEERT